MSAKKVTLQRYECRCELPDCRGGGRTWLSKDASIPERCNWCGRRTWNGRDKRKNMYLTVNGKRQRLSEWSKESGLSAQLIHHRLKVGWTEHDAVTVPAGGSRA